MSNCTTYKITYIQNPNSAASRIGYDEENLMIMIWFKNGPKPTPVSCLPDEVGSIIQQLNLTYTK